MNNKTDIEEDIKRCKELIKQKFIKGLAYS